MIVEKKIKYLRAVETSHQLEATVVQLIDASIVVSRMEFDHLNGTVTLHTIPEKQEQLNKILS